MDLSAYVDSLRADLLSLADAGGPDVRAAADRLTLGLEPAVRMTLMHVLADAAAEITSELVTGSVDVRMRGRDPELVVTAADPPPPPQQPGSPPPPGPSDEIDEDGDVVARVTVRIPDALKTRAEDAATDAGQSLNSWIVLAVRAALRNRAISVDVDLSSRTLLTGRGGRSVQGWAR